MKRSGGRLIYDKLKGMTAEMQLAYWRERTEELLKHQRSLRRHKPVPKKKSKISELSASSRSY